MRIGSLTLPLMTICVCLACASSADVITPEQAKDNVGKTASVCGVVASAKYSTTTKGEPTFLNLDKPFPNHIFTALIWRDDRAKFGEPEKASIIVSAMGR